MPAAVEKADHRMAGITGPIRTADRAPPAGGYPRAPGRPASSLVLSACFVVSYVLPMTMLDIREYLDEDGTSPFAHRFTGLDAIAAAKITVVLARIGQGNLSNVKGVGEGVLEYRLDFGPGYRVYFGRDGDVLVILLAGGTKKRQQQDIEAAQARWAAYKRRKRLAR